MSAIRNTTAKTVPRRPPKFCAIEIICIPYERPSNSGNTANSCDDSSLCR
jgi:hypothetical protein